MSSQLYQRVTDSIVAAVERGAAGDFKMPWHRRGSSDADIGAGIPRNAVTGGIYTGGNVLWLWAAADAGGYDRPLWATYKQWQSVGAQVRKDERATLAIFYKQMPLSRKEKAEDEDGRRSRLVGFGFSLFNAAQVDGFAADAEPPKSNTTDRTARLAHVDAVVAATGANIAHRGVRAYFRPSTDEIVMPERWRFRADLKTRTATEAYYSVLLHELTHWTGHASRLKRDFSGRFGSNAYGFEELVAEIGAAFLCARLGVENEPRPDHAAYVQSWLETMRADRRAIVTAASLAQKACDYVLNRIAAPKTTSAEAVVVVADPEPNRIAA